MWSHATEYNWDINYPLNIIKTQISKAPIVCMCQARVYISISCLRLFQQTIGIPIGIDCAPLSNDLHAYEATSHQGLLKNMHL